MVPYDAMNQFVILVPFHLWAAFELISSVKDTFLCIKIIKNELTIDRELSIEKLEGKKH